MKDVTVKEAVYYAHISGFPSYNYRFWDTFQANSGSHSKPLSVAGEARGKGSIRSLEQLTEEFIYGLEVDHPSTVSTISRTGGKLVFKGYQGVDRPHQSDSEWGVCPYCGW